MIFTSEDERLRVEGRETCLLVTFGEGRGCVLNDIETKGLALGLLKWLEGPWAEAGLRLSREQAP